MIDFAQAQNARELLSKMGKSGDLSLYKAAQDRGISFSALLEEMDPSTPEHKAAGIDAFKRQLMLFDMTAGGPDNIRVDDFFVKNAMMLLPEYIQREVSAGYASWFSPVSLLAAQVADKGPTITPIYLKTTEAKTHVAKRSEAAGFVKSLIAYREKPLAMMDRGRQFDFSYKVLRNQSLAEFAIFLRFIGCQIAQDEVDELWSVCISGDGTSPAPANSFNGTAGTLLYADLVHLSVAFTPPCELTHILCRASDVEKILNFTQWQDPAIWSTLQAIERSGRLTGLLPMNARLVIAPNATTKVLAGIDARWALRETLAQPLMIEADKIISQKLEYAVISKESVYSVMVDDAIKKCDYT